MGERERNFSSSLFMYSTMDFFSVLILQFKQPQSIGFAWFLFNSPFHWCKMKNIDHQLQSKHKFGWVKMKKERKNNKPKWMEESILECWVHWHRRKDLLSCVESQILWLPKRAINKRIIGGTCIGMRVCLYHTPQKTPSHTIHCVSPSPILFRAVHSVSLHSYLLCTHSSCALVRWRFKSLLASVLEETHSFYSINTHTHAHNEPHSTVYWRLDSTVWNNQWLCYCLRATRIQTKCTNFTLVAVFWAPNWNLCLPFGLRLKIYEQIELNGLMKWKKIEFNSAEKYNLTINNSNSTKKKCQTTQSTVNLIEWIIDFFNQLKNLLLLML